MEQKQTHVMYGLLSGIGMAVIGLILYVAGMAFKTGAQYLEYLPFLVFTILNAMAFSKANDGNVTFGNVFWSGFKLAMVAAIIIVVWALASSFIFPDMKEKVIDMMREKMAKQPNMTDDIMEKSVEMTRKWWNIMAVAGGIFGTLFYGAIFSLIGGAVAKKNAVRRM